jgi:hypothetical protein
MGALLAHSVRQPGGIRIDLEKHAEGVTKLGGQVRVVPNLPELPPGLRRLPHPRVHVYGRLPSPTAWSMLSTAKAARQPPVSDGDLPPFEAPDWPDHPALRSTAAFDLVERHSQGVPRQGSTPRRSTRTTSHQVR